MYSTVKLAPGQRHATLLSIARPVVVGVTVLLALSKTVLLLQGAIWWVGGVVVHHSQPSGGGHDLNVVSGHL